MAKYGTTKMLEEDRDLNKSNMEEAEKQFKLQFNNQVGDIYKVQNGHIGLIMK